MDNATHTMKKESNIKKYIWGALFTWSILICWDVYFNNAKNFIDFLFYITGGY
jgi:hypothetical protein